MFVVMVLILIFACVPHSPPSPCIPPAPRVVNSELTFERGILWVSLREVIGLYGLIVSLILNTAVGTMQVCLLVSLLSYPILTSGFRESKLTLGLDGLGGYSAEQREGGPSG